MAIAVRKTESDMVDAYWETLRTLSVRAKLKLASLLTTAAFEEESRRDTDTALQSGKTRRVVRRASEVPSDAELQARFSGKEIPCIPEDPSWSQVIDSNTGKTIQPIEKWL